MYYYSIVTSEKSNLAMFKNHTFSASMLHKAKIQHCHSFCYWKEISRIMTHNIRILIFELESFSMFLEQVS